MKIDVTRQVMVEQIVEVDISELTKEEFMALDPAIMADAYFELKKQAAGSSSVSLLNLDSATTHRKGVKVGKTSKYHFVSYATRDKSWKTTIPKNSNRSVGDELIAACLVDLMLDSIGDTVRPRNADEFSEVEQRLRELKDAGFVDIDQIVNASREKRKPRTSKKISKYQRVTKTNANDKWRARMDTESKRINIGTYDTELEAAIAGDLYLDSLGNAMRNRRRNRDRFPEVGDQANIDAFIRKYKPDYVKTVRDDRYESEWHRKQREKRNVHIIPDEIPF